MENNKQRSKKKKKHFIHRFKNLWTLENTEDNLISEAPPVPVQKIFRRFWPYAKKYKWWMFLSLLLIVLLPVISSATVWLLQAFIDRVLVPQNFTALYPIILAYLSLAVLRGLFYFSSTYLSNWVGENFILTLRKGLYNHLQGLSLSFFESRKLGDIISRMSSDIGSIERLVISGATSAVSYMSQLVVFIGMLFFMQWKLALISLVVVPLFYIVTRFFSRRMKLASRERSRREGGINSISEESFSNIALLQAYNQQDAESDRFDLQNERSFDAKMLKVRLKATFSPIVNFIETLGTLVVMTAGALLLFNGEMTIGALVAFMTLLGKLYRPVRGLSKLLNTIYSASASAERVIEFMDEKPMIKEEPYALENTKGSVEFREVSFSYPNKPKKILSDISFSIDPGESVALVGASGTGKSTIVKLLMRFYDPTSGNILVDGNVIKGVKLESLRDNVAVLFQESLIFDGTVKENIAYGKPEASEDEIIEAAKLAGAHDFITELSEGYDTPVGQKGRNLSGGQQQRVAIARAIIRKASILILDEPTEGLDAKSEKQMMDPLKELMKDKATLVITHNLRSAAAADKILHLEKGKVIESGTHEELLQRGGKYAELYEMQNPEKKHLKAVPKSEEQNDAKRTKAQAPVQRRTNWSTSQ